METSLLNVQDLSLPQRPLYDSLKRCFAVNRYDRWTFFFFFRSDPVWGMSLYQSVSFPVREHLKLFQWSGRLARRLFCIPWYFVVPHFISFNCKLLNKQLSLKQKALSNQFDLILWRYSFLIGWHLLHCSFSLYLRYHPDGLGGPVNHCTVINLSILHPYSINQSVTNPSSEALNSNEAFSGESCIQGCWTWL